MTDAGVAGDVVEEEATGGLTHEGGLVGDGGEAGGDVLGMGIVGEADEGDIVGDAEAHLGDGVVGSEGDDVVEGEDGVGPVGAVEKGTDGLGGDVEVDFATGDEGAVDGHAGIAEGLEVAVLATGDHVEVVRTSDEGDATGAGLKEVLGGLIGCFVAIGLDGGEELGEAGAGEEDEGYAHLGYLLEVGVVGGVLCETGDDAFDVEVDEVVDGAYLGLDVLMAVGADDAVALGSCFLLDAVEDGAEEVGDEMGDDDADDLGLLVAQGAREGVGAVVELLGQGLDALLHLLTYLGGTAQGPADGGNADTELGGEVLE